MKSKKGFTLIEMMVVVLVLAGLAAIAYPSYSKSINRARVAEAFSLVEIVREAQQRNLAVNGNYFGSFTNKHISGRTRLIKSGDVTVSGGQLIKGMYRVSIADEGTGNNAIDNGCIVVRYGQNAGDPLFTIYTHVEDSRIWCEELNDNNGICGIIPALETTAVDCA